MFRCLTDTDIRGRAVYSVRRDGSALTCETRLSTDSPRYQLVITKEGHTSFEDFMTLTQILARENQLLAAWRSWR